MRAVGQGQRALVVQFIKGPWASGEDESHKSLPNFIIVKKGLGFVGIQGDTIPFAKHKEAAQEAIDYAKKELLSNQWNIVVLDEIWNALYLGLVSDRDVLDFFNIMKSRSEHALMTGRNCPRVYIDKADLVTEMKEVKHPYSKGTKAKAGVEF